MWGSRQPAAGEMLPTSAGSEAPTCLRSCSPCTHACWAGVVIKSRGEEREGSDGKKKGLDLLKKKEKDVDKARTFGLGTSQIERKFGIRDRPLRTVSFGRGIPRPEHLPIASLFPCKNKKRNKKAK